MQNVTSIIKLRLVSSGQQKPIAELIYIDKYKYCSPKTFKNFITVGVEACREKSS